MCSQFADRCGKGRKRIRYLDGRGEGEAKEEETSVEKNEEKD